MRHFTIFIFLFCLSSYAKDETTQQKESFFLKFHKRVSTDWDSANSRIDTFFAKDTYEDEIADSYVRFNLLTAIIEGDGIKNDYNIKFKTDFPNTTKDIQLVFSKDSSDPADVDSEQDRDDLTPKNLDDTYKDATYSAAIRYIIKENRKWNVHTDTGIRSNLPLDPFIKLRLRRSFMLSTWTTNIIQQINYYKQEKLKESTTIELHHKLTDMFQMTFNSGLSWTHDTSTFSINHGLTLYQKGTDKRAYSYSIGAHANTEPTIYYDSYSMNAGARQLAYKDWFFVQTNLGATFSKSENFKMKKYFSISTEVFF